MPREKSAATTCAPAAANGSDDDPVPAARSSTRSPGRGVDRLRHGPAPEPGLAQRQHVVGEVVALGDVVEHGRDLVRLLVQVGDVLVGSGHCHSMPGGPSHPLAAPAAPAAVAAPAAAADSFFLIIRQICTMATISGSRSTCPDCWMA